jgi:uncharacterized protein YndB with AHSA1/START domain
VSERPVGLTRDAGWQIGVSRTFPADVESVWELLTSAAGLELWLGKGVPTPLTKGASYRTRDGTRGEIRSVRPLDRVRLTWQPEGRDAPATVQLAVARSPRGCSVRFHTEHLASQQEREAMRTHWRKILDRLDGSSIQDPSASRPAA